MRSKSSSKIREIHEIPVLPEIEYLEIIKNKYFDFYGIFAYLQFDFKNDLIVEEM